MAVSIQYKTLFQLEVLHHYFLSGGPLNKEFGEMTDSEKATQKRLYQLSDFLEIQPDQSTFSTMRGLKQTFRRTADGFHVLASVDNSDHPLINIQEDTKWTFGLILKDANFWNYTNLRLTPGFDSNIPARNNIPRLFYYSNTNSGITAPHLTKDIPAFSGTGTYQMNDLVTHGGDMFESVINNPPGPNPLSVNSGWQEIDYQEFASNQDEIRWRPTYFNYQFTDANIWALFELKNRKGETIYQENGQSTDSNLLFPIDMSSYPSGWYQLDVTGNTYTDTQEFYYHPEFRGKSLLGIVEIFHQNGLATGLEILNVTGEVAEQLFDLRFKNRLTKWRYKDSTDQTVVDTIDGIADALPLTRTGFISSVERNGKKLPNPDAKMIITETDAIYSDVYIDSGQYPL